jgi:hypothetical protein
MVAATNLKEDGRRGAPVDPLRIEVAAGRARYVAGSGIVPRDSARCSIHGRVFSPESYSAALCELARALVAAGVPDRPYEVINTAKPRTVALRGPSIHAMAAMIEAHPERGARFIRYRPPKTGGTTSPMCRGHQVCGAPGGNVPALTSGVRRPEVGGDAAALMVGVLDPETA